jgi:hypothetical protein
VRWSAVRAAPRPPVVGIAYALALLVSNVWLESASPRTERRVLYDVSTNLRHLARDPWAVIATSAFFTRGGVLFAVAGALVCVGLLERVAGWRMTAVVAVTAHVIGTLVSEGVVAIRIAAHNLPTAARNVLDVGPSYVIVGCAAAAIAWPGAARWVRGIVAVAITPLFVFTAWRLPAGRIDAIGHVTAAAVGVLWALWKRRVPPLGEEAVP